MNYHPTPTFVANALKKHLPKNPNKILEPAAGEGALLTILPKSLQASPDLTIIDIDSDKCKVLRSLFQKSRTIQADFIQWAIQNPHESFDLIITNPPFSGKPENWIKLLDEKAPIEVIFLKLAIERLSNDGTLIAIVPDSIARSMRWASVREEIHKTCVVTFSYQLPEKCFDSIEGAFYLVVIKKSTRTKKTKLINFTNKTNYLIISSKKMQENRFRMDYEYYAANESYLKLLERISGDLVRYENVFKNATRGSIRSGYKEPKVIHTSSFNNLYYGDKPFSQEHYVSNPASYCIAVKRVSRNSHLTFGLLLKSDKSRCSDCIVYFDSEFHNPLELLFFLRVVYANQNGRAMLLKGTGAKYISVEELRSLTYYKIQSLNPSLFAEYISSYIGGQYAYCLELETSMTRFLIHGEKVKSLSTAKVNEIKKMSSKKIGHPHLSTRQPKLAASGHKIRTTANED